MSLLSYGGVALSVPPMKDTTPCMPEMLQYEDCIKDSNFTLNMEVYHPNWPSVFPRLLQDGNIYPEGWPTNIDASLRAQFALSKKTRQFLWECEEERFVYKACLREVIGLQRSERHRSWDTAEVANLQFT